MFLLIEKENDENLKNARRNTFLSVLAKHNISVNNTVIKEIVSAAVSASEVNGLSLKDYAMATLSDWNLGSSVFFAGTIVTTIGKCSTLFVTFLFCSVNFYHRACVVAV